MFQIFLSRSLKPFADFLTSICIKSSWHVTLAYYTVCVGPVMSGLESGALFKERALSFGLDEATLNRLIARGYGHFWQELAFCSAYRPGQSDEAPLMTALANILGRNVDDGEAPALRRLHFEASTLVMSDMKNRVERTDTTEPRRLPMAERTSRLEKQRNDLVGVVINQDNEPSHSLVEKIFQQLEG